MKNKPSKIPRLSLDHVTKEYAKDVYEPSADTYLLVDAIESDAMTGRLNKCFTKSDSKTSNAFHIVEIGCGSGVVITSVYHILQQYVFPTFEKPNYFVSEFIVTDINAKALGWSQLTCVQTTLLESLELDQRIDLLIFNPPYVATELSELERAHNERQLAAAWAGGPNGTFWIDILLPCVSTLLSKDGAFYLVTIASNNPYHILQVMKTQFHLFGTITFFFFFPFQLAKQKIEKFLILNMSVQKRNFVIANGKRKGERKKGYPTPF
ncbi:hypothetical protein RFI_30844 [Reticulomyxa filosa]|uniref:Uncharacterized protein n=1 Tax=Reticulomyxa filosa TaxID=46433 RepID=X6LZH1_RETFI|nr:hypothetical protein RFI_30844 [Reticulomyxa filosa]|eukprot:ETO06547.1 hypothetical protein RFI_30844 [Reticulomyxa filosa]